MNKYFKNVIAFFLILLLSIFTVKIILVKIISRTSLKEILQRVPNSEILLVGLLTIIIFLFYLQWITKKLWNPYLYFFYTCYVILLVVLLFNKSGNKQGMNLNPFAFFYWSPGLLEAFLNIVAFIPLGILYGIRLKKWELIVISLVTIFTIEMLQYLFYLGVFATSDILCNFLGCIIGFYLYPVIKKHFALENS